MQGNLLGKKGDGKGMEADSQVMEGVENVELASECSSSVTTTTTTPEGGFSFCFSCDSA